MLESLYLENFRCFAGKFEIPLRPLTVLVGENSSGKSSFLAAARLAWDCGIAVSRGKAPDFNEEPFPLGAYRQIATANGKGSAAQFSLGLTVDRTTRLRADFVEAGAQPELLEAELRQGSAVQRFSEERAGAGFPVGRHPAHVFRPETRPMAFSPIRTRPKRTYDPVQELPDPSGVHVPMILARIHAADEASWKRIAETLQRFGQASGLLQGLEVRSLGKEDDPFQVEVRIHGKNFNLVDVGYGVSQILPILVECVRGPEEGVFLLQQPEVHLHPRAQAELGTFFATLANERRQQFLIETHSDHLVDRLRLEVRQGLIQPKDLVILFFERGKDGTRIHPMTTDDQGNLLDAPPGYRRFFLDEERRLLGL